MPSTASRCAELDPTFDDRLEAAYRAATDKGLWKGTYAGSNREEYWAEGVQDWFDNNRENDALHNHVNTRAELKEYDPALASCAPKCSETIRGATASRSTGPRKSARHLAGVEWDKLPQFRWREEPIPDVPRVLIQTELGDIELELDAHHAPHHREELPAVRPRRILQRRRVLPHGDHGQPAGRPRSRSKSSRRSPIRRRQSNCARRYPWSARATPD